MPCNDLHVDDSEGVAEEGRRHRFDVVVVSPGDPDWVARVLEAAQGRFTGYVIKGPEAPG